MSRSPKTVIATVRGIGVAVITSTCGGAPALAFSAARCSTPKRCCSSTTTSPRSANCTCSSSRAWVPITMPASPPAASASACPPGGGVERAGQQRHPGPALGAAEETALGEVAEHGRDRALVLLGEHLGRGEQRCLAAGVDHLEHRAERDDRLAGADLALQQPVHRVALAELGGDLLPHAALAVGQGEREPLVEPVEDAPRSAGAGVGDRGLDRRPPPGEHGLRDEGLVVLEPLLGRDLLAPVVRPVDPAQRLVDLDEVLGLTHLRREQLGDVGDEVEGEPDRVLELPGVHAGHGGVERDQVGHLGEVAALPAVHPGGGVGQLPLVVEPLQPPAEHAHAAHRRAPGWRATRRCSCACRSRSAAGCRPGRGRAPRGGRPCGAYAGPGRASGPMRPPRRPGRGCRPR